ncbi:MAG TPA: SDR family oxidoreductase [Candidatus Deferrimicrobium sp.]|nr:SDR family oxidoreductase [Candidatus Deferrimicrobium sp.]
MGKLDGKVAIIAYAGGGIGKATAELFAKEGAKVIVQDDDAAKLEGVPGEKFIGDLRKQEDADKLIQFAKEKGGGKIDIIFNNEDFAEDKKKLTELTSEEFKHIVDMNLKTIWHTLAAAYPIMKEQNALKVINIGNVAGASGTPKLVAYSSVKAGLYGLTKTVAKEWQRFPGVRVNMINAGMVKFPKEGYASQGEGKTAAKTLSLNNPFAAVAATPQDIANVALFLASSESDAINAATIDAFGGVYTVSGE